MEFEKGDKFEHKDGKSRAKIIGGDEKGYYLMVYDDKMPQGYKMPIQEEILKEDWNKDNRYKVEDYFG